MARAVSSVSRDKRRSQKQSKDEPLDDAGVNKLLEGILSEQTDEDEMYASELKGVLLRLRPDFNEKAFGCTAWREGCRFTLWKDCLTRGGGPTLNAKLAVLILVKGAVRGSSGEIQLREGRISFVPSGTQTPSVSVPIIYEKK